MAYGAFIWRSYKSIKPMLLDACGKYKSLKDFLTQT